MIAVCNCVFGSHNKSVTYYDLSPLETTLPTPWEQIPWSHNYLPLPAAIISSTPINSAPNPEPNTVIAETQSTSPTPISGFDSSRHGSVIDNDYLYEYPGEVVVNTISHLSAEGGEQQFQRDMEFLVGGAPRGVQRKRIISRKKPNVAKTSNGGNEYSNEYRIKKWLFQTLGYDKTTRPVRRDETQTTLHIGMSLYHILDTVSVTGVDLSKILGEP